MVDFAPTLEEAPKTTLNPELVKGIEVHTDYEIPDVPEEVLEVCQQIKDLGGQAFLVGGVVRDTVMNAEHDMGITSKDFDVEIFGVSKADLQHLLIDRFGEAEEAGDKFPVFKVYMEGLSEPLDFGVARTETKTGVGHKGFDVEARPDLTLMDSAKRRDLALNAMAYDPLTKETFDPFNGVEDIRNRVINVTKEETFVEDPLRVLRVAQFASRFEYKVSSNTQELCSRMVQTDMLTPATKADFVDVEEFEGVTPERISTEFEKLLLKGRKPSVGMEFLDEIGYLDKYFVYEDTEGNEVKFTQLRDTEQDQVLHPEGNVWLHTLQTMDAASEVIAVESQDTRTVEIGEFTFENVPNFVTERQLRELVASANASMEKKANDFRRELVEAVLSELHTDFEESKKEHDQKVEKEIEREYEAYLKRVESHASWKTLEVSDNSKRKARAKIKKAVESEHKAEWDKKLSKMFGSLVASGAVNEENIALLEEEAQKRAIAFRNRKVKLDRISLERDMKMTVMLGVMLHDIGKISTTEFSEKEGRIIAHSHAEEGVDPAKQMLEFFHNTRVSRRTKSVVLELIKYHMAPWDAERDYPKYLEVVAYKKKHPGKELPKKLKKYPQGDPRSGLKRRSRDLRKLGGNVKLLGMVAEADTRGRRPQAEGSTPLDRNPDLNIKTMYDHLIFAQQAVEAEERTQDVAVSGNLIKEVLKDELGGSDKKGAPFVGVIKNALLAAEEAGEFTRKEEGEKLIRPLYEKFQAYVTANSTDDASEKELWLELRKLDDPREVLS